MKWAKHARTALSQKGLEMTFIRGEGGWKRGEPEEGRSIGSYRRPVAYSSYL